MREEELPSLPPDDFARRFGIRAPSLMWFLGAGASASGGVPTAWDMIWEFKRRLFVSQRKVSPKSVADLSNPGVRNRLQEHVTSSGSFPPEGAPEEYAALFEAVFPAESDRTAYIETQVRGAMPSYGHLSLAALMKARQARIVWTTNFDPLVADACARVYGGTGPLSSVDLDRSHLAADLISNERWPIELKIHGDFRSRRLKNTSDELREQDQALRKALVAACRRFGLIVVGYSGRDESVMDTLDEVVAEPGAFPAGLFWLHRGRSSPLPRVGALLRNAASAGVEAALVRVENFDEVARDLIRGMDSIDTTSLDAFAEERRVWTAAPRTDGSRGWPIVRLNGLLVSAMPTACRKVGCTIGGFREVREAAEKAEVDVLVARTTAGVLAFGSDADVRKAYEPFGITEFDLHTIETKRLRYDSGERGLLRDALSRGLAREFQMDVSRRRNGDLLAPADPAHARWKDLRTIVRNLTGRVSAHPEVTWREGVSIRLEWANDRLWLLIEPRPVFDGLADENRAAASDFSRERSVDRYNRKANDLIDFWARLFDEVPEIRALGIADGVDALFSLDERTAFSWRSRP